MNEEKDYDPTLVSDIKHAARLELLLCVAQLGVYARQIQHADTNSALQRQELILLDREIEDTRKVIRRMVDDRYSSKKKTILRVVK